MYITTYIIKKKCCFRLRLKIGYKYSFRKIELK